MFTGGVPTANISLNDVSGASTDLLFSPPSEGLCVPLVFLMAERGIPGEIYYGGGAELTKFFGSSTFRPGSAYFNSATRFAATAMAGQGVNAIRLVDPVAKTATLALFVSSTPADLTQYKKDAQGKRLVDGNGDYIPKTAVDGVTIVKEPGLIVKWLTRALDDDESFDTLETTTVTASGKTTTIRPVLAFEVEGPGKFGNRQGFKLSSATRLNSTVSREIGSALYRFVPMELPTDVSTTAKFLPDVYGTSFSDVSFKRNAVYVPNNTNYDFDYVLNNSYVEAKTGDNKLPYNVYVYSENMGELGEAVLDVSPELVDVDPYEIDLISGTNVDGKFYDHLKIDEASLTVVNTAVINYATGGTDGDTSWAKFDQLVADWCAGSDHGEFGNIQQHPMTHYSDPGFSVPTKILLFTMLGLRDNIKIDVSTQDIALPLNTKAEDIANGQALMFRAQMYPESTLNGVGCMRVGIYAQAAKLVSDSPYGGVVPFTLNRLIQRRNLDGGTYVKGSSGGMPASEVTIFRKPKWTADDKVSQEITWENCINAVRHASRTKIHYPAYRTVYPNDTSLLSDDEVSDRLVYMYKIARAVYARYAGKRGKAEKLYPLIQRDIENECAMAFSGDNINVTATISQTAIDNNLGYAVTAKLKVTGTLSLRVMNIDVEVGRETATE